MIQIKRGDTFRLNAVVQEDGVPIVGGISGWTITSQLRASGGTAIDTLKVTVTNPTTGAYTIEESVAGVTADWPVGLHKCDIKYDMGGDITHTETFPVQVLREVTV